MIAFKSLKAAICVLAFLATPAMAQFSDAYNFLKAVRDRDGGKAGEYMSKPGSVLVNTPDISTEETALHLVTKDGDLQWMNFVLGKGAKADVRDKQGNTPLIMATRARFTEGVNTLLRNGAGVDFPNSSGETALIVAVQIRDAAMTRLLLNNGANPDKKDRIAGLSARDYAKADSRATAVLRVIEEPRAKAKAAASMGPKL